MNFLLTIYHRLTAYLPRPLPRNDIQYAKLKETLTLYYGLEDKPEIWAVIASQVQAQPCIGLRKAYGKMANEAKRLKINALAEEQKRLAYREIEAKLEAKAKEVAEELARQEQAKDGTDMQEGSPDLQQPVPGLSLD